MTKQPVQDGIVVRQEAAKLKREITLIPLFSLIYFTVCGGAFGFEAVVGFSGPILALLLMILTPLFFSIPNMLIVREMNSMMPVEGGYYHWVKQAFGPLAGFMAGWMNWVVSWVDVSIYPVLAAYYIGYFIPAIREGTVILGVQVDGWILQWAVGLLLIVVITLLNIRGAKLVGMTASWLGVVMLLPLLAMSVVGIANWIRSGVTISLPLLPPGENLTGALSVGLFIVMWNFIGWELPTAAGDEIVNPKRTYPLAMAMVLVAAIATYALPTLAGLYGGAGANGQYLLWGQEEYEDGQGIAVVLSDYGIQDDQIEAWGVNPQSAVGWEYPDIAHAIGAAASGDENGFLAKFLGITVSFSAILSMIGLFIGNSLGGTRVPFAMAEDGMMPKWMVKVHPKYGTPWVAILICGIIYTIFTLQAFSFLVVVDVFLNMLVLLMEIAALWKLRKSMPNLERQKVPGGLVGLIYVTLGPVIFVSFAIFSQMVEEGLQSLWLALVAMAIGAAVYFVLRKTVKPGIPDVDPFRPDPEEI